MGNGSQKIRVIVTEDHPVTRLGLCGIVEANSNMEITGEAASGSELLALLDKEMPDVLLLDLMLPDTDGFQLLRQLKATQKLPHTLVISMCKEEIYAQRVFKLGALGYVMKNACAEEVVSALETVARGDVYASQVIKDKMFRLAICPNDEAHEKVLQSLSDREFEVLTYLGQHLGNRQIADILKINDRTIATYKVRLRDKLDCQSMEDLEAKAVALLNG